MHLTQLFKNKQFVVTCEVVSPKGIDIEEFLDTADLLRECISAVSVGDNQRAVMRAGALSMCHLLKLRNIEPVMELSALYRNRLTFQSEILSAAILGIENVLLLMGYDPSLGDHAEAKAVYDLDPISIVNAAISLTEGKDLAGHALNAAPDFCIGVSTTLEGGSDESHLRDLKEQVARGVDYIQTQAIYDPEILERFMELTSNLNVPVVVSHALLKSASMASFMNSNFPGVSVPEKVIKELEGLTRNQVVDTSLQISIELLKKMKTMCQGIHVIPAGWENYVPRIIEEVAK